MADIMLNAGLLSRLFRRNNFELPAEEMVFFGIRGALPIDITGTPFASEHRLRVTDIDHLHMRCTLGQFLPKTGELAVFPGSTVPWQKYIQSGVRRTMAVNMLMLGYYSYCPGPHRGDKPSGHRAFRQASFFPVWRTYDDLDYDLNDQADLDGGIVWDNLHCAFNDNVGSPGFGSAGCQVVCGQPKSAAREHRPETGPWKRFIENAYALKDQKLFAYGLFSGIEAAMIQAKPAAEVRQSLRFGSSGPLVEQLQQILIAKGAEIGTPDGQFGRNTIEALMAFQTREFGRGSADGIVGPNTASALGMTLPMLNDSAAEPLSAPQFIRPSFHLLEQEENRSSSAANIVVSQSGKDWHASIDGGKKFYVGTATSWSRYEGLYQPAAKIGSVPGSRFEPEQWAAKLGDQGAWAWFLWPTIKGESGGWFNRINTYDGAGLTFGAFQFASHTPGDNLILLMRRLADRKQIKRWFPDLELQGGKLHRRTAAGLVSLEKEATNGRLADFMEYLNPDASTVSAAEALAAARLIGWAAEEPELEAEQVALAIKRFAARVGRLGTSYGVDLSNQPIHRLIWVADILHHGRGKYVRMRDALGSSDPDAQLARIGSEDPKWRDRIQTVQAAIAEVKPKLAGQRWGKGAFSV